MLRDHDHDLSGHLDSAEMREALCNPQFKPVLISHRKIYDSLGKCGEGVSKEETDGSGLTAFRAYMRDMDPNGNGMITEDEFVNASLWTVGIFQKTTSAAVLFGRHE